MCPRRVAAHHEQAIGVVYVVVTSGGRIGSQRLFVTRYGAAHAQAGISVDVIRSHQAFDELVENVIIFGQQLTRNIKTNRIRPMFTNDAGKSIGTVA